LSLQDPLDATFIQPYDAYSFSGSLVPPTPALAGSPPAMPVASSADSGIGLDMPSEGMNMDGSSELHARDQRHRSSSEEKDGTLTAAQSRRKAQNRAAYASPAASPTPTTT